MSTLCDWDIQCAVKYGRIEIAPFDEKRVQPASYDVTLADTFQIPCGVAYNERVSIDRAAGRFPRMTPHQGKPLRLNPGCFVLGSTVERVKLDARHLAKLDGKSTLGRLGLVVHCTAGYIDPGFEGQITLELFNCAPYPIELVPGCPIGQLRFERLQTFCERPYGSEGLGSHYQGQSGPTTAKL